MTHDGHILLCYAASADTSVTLRNVSFFSVTIEFSCVIAKRSIVSFTSAHASLRQTNHATHDFGCVVVNAATADSFPGIVVENLHATYNGWLDDDRLESPMVVYDAESIRGRIVRQLILIKR